MLDRDRISLRYTIPNCPDFDSLENNDVTIRDRDTMKQERMKISELKKFFQEKI